MSIKMSQKVTHEISGFTGTVIARTEWRDRGVQFGVQRDGLHYGRPMETVWFAEGELMDAQLVEEELSEQGG